MSPKKEPGISSIDALSQLSKGLSSFVVSPNIIGYKPHGKQEEFHRSLSKINLFIGGNRSGKTVGGCAEDVFRLRGQHPYKSVPPAPIRGRIVGVDFINGVEQILMPEIARWLPIGDLKGGSWYSAYDNVERVLTLENGSTLQFRSYEQDTDKFAGVSLHFVHMDEEPPQPIYKECMARLVDTGGDMYLTLTPVEGMTWLFDEIYEPGVNKQNANIHVVEVDTMENPYLTAAYVDIFKSTLDEDEIEARIHGKFNERGGLIYKNFGQVHILDEFDHNQPGLLIARSMDHGFNNPTAWGWFAVNSDEQVTLFHEYYDNGKTVSQLAEQVSGTEQALGVVSEYSVGDPSIRNTDPITGTSIFEEYSKYGIYIIPGNNDVKAGIIRVAGFLRPRVNDQPWLRVTKNCTNTIREFNRYRWAKFSSSKSQYQNNAREMPQKKDDHCMDMIRYFIMSRPDLSPTPVGQLPKPSQPMAGFGSVAVEEELIDRPSQRREGNLDLEYAGFREMSLESTNTTWTVDNVEGDW